MKIRKTLLTLAGALLLAVPLVARMSDSQQLEVNSRRQPRRVSLLSGAKESDEPADFWRIWWVDAGNLSDFLVSNTLQGGVFPRHLADKHEYRGEYPRRSVALRASAPGHNAEYPKGAEQYYCWAWGLWVGSMYPTGNGEERKPNVSKTAFYTDMGAMAEPRMKDGGGMGDISAAGLYFSDMTIPKGFGFTGEEQRLFALPGTTPLSYQVKWPFVDSAAINPLRRKIHMPEVSPANGDIISMQDSYARAGDWIPAKDATTIWVRNSGGGVYDVWGQGLRIEQRTYAWNYEYNDSYIFINYKIKNMNEFDLEDIYVSFFMDNDIGQAAGGTSPGDPAAWDDLIGFDKELNMGYTYDSDGAEPGWVTPAGYIGAVLLDTPGDIGLTGFETWQNGSDIDLDAHDSLKYVYMASTQFNTWQNPNDVRMLLNCGPYDVLKAGEEINVTIAVIVAYSLDELQEKAKAAKIQFNNGYFGYAPPPNPQLNVIPGNGKVYLNWSSSPEGYIDPMSHQPTFEGYRVYRSLSGLAETWDLLADYDLADSKNPDTVIVDHTVGPSTAVGKFLGFHPSADLAKIGFGNNTYTLTFKKDPVSGNLYYLIYNIGDQKQLSYNEEALKEGGYCVLDTIDGKVVKIPGSVNATGTVTFTVTADSTDTTVIPKGTKVSTDSTITNKSPVTFETTAEASVVGNGTADVAIKAIAGGSSGNVSSGTITKLVDAIAHVTAVTNSTPTSGGTDGQDYYPYKPGDVIFIDGAQITILEDKHPEKGDIVTPISGAKFTVKTYAAEQLSGQTGLKHYYVDEKVDNGKVYYYSVTSYSRSQPLENVSSLEGGKTGKTYWAVPRSNPLGWQKSDVSNLKWVSSRGNAFVNVSVVSPDQVTGDEYEVGFFADTNNAVKYAYIKDITNPASKSNVDTFLLHSGVESGPVVDGVKIQIAGVSVDTLDLDTLIDTLHTGWLKSTTTLNWNVGFPQTAGGAVPYTHDYLITVAPGKDDKGKTMPITVSRYGGGSGKFALLWSHGKSAKGLNKDDVLDHGDKLFIYKDKIQPGSKEFEITFKDTLLLIDTFRTASGDTFLIDSFVYKQNPNAILPQQGDQFLIKTLKATVAGDRCRFTTIPVEYDTAQDVRTLDSVRVVPNPYYITAPWDENKYARHVIFQNLPQTCTIRIFNSAGLLIRTIEHDGTGLLGSAGSEDWNLLTSEGLDCSNGLYIWQVKTKDGKQATGKFAIVKSN